MVAEVAAAQADQVAAQKRPHARTSAAKRGDILEVVGGVGKGGIIVRTGKDKASPEADLRLATGAVIRATCCEGERLSYELVSGEGPQSGWVSLSAGGKALVVNRTEQQEQEAVAGLKWYSHRFEEARKLHEDCIYRKSSFPLRTEILVAGRSQEQLEEELKTEAASMELKQRQQARKAASRGRRAAEVDIEQDSDGEMVRLCRHCHLPLGSHAYARDGKIGSLMHGECMAQVMLKDMRREEEELKQRATETKDARRKEYDIGWKANMIPSVDAAAAKLGFQATPHSMCCLSLNVQDLSVRVAPTFEPASALNLEYLSLALQVRRLEGREPLFSLDPVDAAKAKENDPEASMQMKKFEPEWLAGTSVGEVMFQADYHLKELSMGEHAQPVVGMKSCFDLSEQEGLTKDWNAREWFIVRQAAITMSDDNVLIPVLKMGVEAREQLVGPNGLEDAPLTRPDHPLVRYAEAFTRNFDLIAERKGVVSQLREVAKAAIMAKFLLESGINLPDAWFDLGAPTSPVCCLEVPQLWNDRSTSTIKVQDGTIDRKDKSGRIHSVYGGVDFGIDRFRLGAPSRIATSVVAGRVALGRPSATLMASSQVNMSLIPTRQFTRLAAPLSMRPALSAAAPIASQLAAPITARAGLAAPLSAMSAARPASRLMSTSRISMGAQSRLAAPISAMAGARPASALMATSRISMAAPQVTTTRVTMGMPRGVDLNLERFNLSAAEQDGQWAGVVEAPADAANTPLGGKAFWSAIASENSVFSSEDHSLLKDIFHSSLCDRKGEEERFVPPPTNNVDTLRSLIQAEADLRSQRKTHFFSKEFSPKEPGQLFPASWASTVEIAGAEAAGKDTTLQARPDILSQTALLKDLLEGAEPTFDRRAEDGVRFLVYRLGGLEVRATEAPGDEQVVGAVFSVRSKAPAPPKGQARLSDEEKLVKAVEYVETSAFGKMGCSFFAILLTEQGHRIVTERNASGAVSWMEDPSDIEGRLSLAKVIDSVDTRGMGLTVGAMRVHAAKEAKAVGRAMSGSGSKRYAHGVCNRAGGRQAAPAPKRPGF